jgi:serine/threonine protein kinase
VTNNDEELLSDLLLQWEELYERGQDTPADQLCGSNQRLVEELSQRIAALKATNWLKDPNPRPIEDSSTDSQAKESRPARILMNRYRLDHLIAEGGFAQVWRAYDKELQRIVAVKIPKPSRLESTDSFLAEARRVARLKHPGIVPVHDVGVENGTCFIVSEFVEGGSLGDQLARFSPTPEQVVRWIAEIADALEYAHLHGIIHRDIKPANILIDHHGRALLADFGIAQSANKTGSFAPSLGTLRYMAPEQLDGQSATPASDVFSLGLVLHEALAGKLPYSSDSPSVVRREIAQWLNKAVSHTIPGPLRPVCEKALNREPQKRHTSASHFCADLKTAWKKKPPRKLWWWIVLPPVVYLLAFVLIGFVLLSLIRSHAEVVRKQTQERIDRDMRGTPAPEDINKIQDRLYEPGGLVDSIRKMTEELGKDAAKKTAEEDKPDSSQ